MLMQKPYLWFWVFFLPASPGTASFELSTLLRHRAIYFENFGLYEKNRKEISAEEMEHEVRADLFMEGGNSLFQLRVGRLFADHEKFKRPPKEDVLRIHQAYLDIPLQGMEDLALRIGRQELLYNREVLIGANDWDMEGNSFDAIKLYRDGPTWDLDVIYGRQAEESRNELAGINLEKTTPQKTVQELYAWYTGIPRDQNSIPLTGSPDLEVFTFGARMEGKLSAPLFYHGMINFQTGSMEDHSGTTVQEFDVEAFNLLFNLDYFANHPVIRNVGFEVSVSSGDNGATPKRYETFLPPFASGHNRSGAMDWMSMMNSKIFTLYLFADLHPKVEALLEFHKFYLYSGESAWYIEDLSAAWWDGMEPSRWDWPSTGWRSASTKDIGSELDFHARIGSDTDRQFSIGYSLFFPGKMLKNHLWKKDQTAQWAYIQTELKF